MTATCKVRVPDGGRLVSFHACGRKLSGSADYPELCGLHASVKRRAEEKENARHSLRDERAKEVGAADEQVASLSVALGVTVSAQTATPWVGPEAGISRPTGYALLKLDDLAKIAERLRELEQENLRRRLGENR
jgi:hypothetical protein